MRKAIRNLALSFAAAVSLPAAAQDSTLGYPYDPIDRDGPKYAELGGQTIDQSEYSLYKHNRAMVVFADRAANDGRQHIYICKGVTPRIQIDFNQAVSISFESAKFDRKFFFTKLEERTYEPESIELDLQNYFRNCVQRNDLDGLNRLQREAREFNSFTYSLIRREEQRAQDIETLMSGKLPQWCIDLGPDNICTYMLPRDQRPTSTP